VPDLLRVFFDANVLFSASWEPDHDFLAFWRDPGVVCMTSFYASGEARRNCFSDEQSQRLERLLEMTHFVSDASRFMLPAEFALPPKDKPILAAAIQAGVDYLITGDLVIMLPRPFLQLLARKP
jgi:predicted nucleic acid-binding protein